LKNNNQLKLTQLKNNNQLKLTAIEIKLLAPICNRRFMGTDCHGVYGTDYKSAPAKVKNIL